jgi:hypothetical protein
MLRAARRPDRTSAVARGAVLGSFISQRETAVRKGKPVVTDEAKIMTADEVVQWIAGEVIDAVAGRSLAALELIPL